MGNIPYPLFNLPLCDTVGHNKTKLFISHMGMGGFTEGVDSATPFLCYPSGLDQYYNTRRAMEVGMAERICDLDELPSQVVRVWNDKNIRNNAR